MTISSIIPLVAALAYIPLLFILITNRPWNKQHKLFAVYLAAAMLWSLSTFLLRTNYLSSHTLLIFKLTICFFILLIVQYMSFLKNYFYGKGGRLLYAGYALLAIIIFGAVMGFMPQELYVENGTVAPTLGFWLPLISVIPFLFLLVMISDLVRKLRTSTDPLEHDRIIYFLAGISVVATLGVAGLSGIGDKYPIIHLGHMINALLLTYATLRYRILDMTFIARRTLVYGAMIGIVLSIYIAWAALVHLVFKMPMSFVSYVLVMVLTVVTCAFFWVRTRIYLYEKVDEIFYGESYDVRQELSNFLAHGISNVFDLQEFSRGLLPPLVKVANCQQAYMLLPETSSGDFVVVFTEPALENTKILSIKRNSPIVEWLTKNNRYLSRENIDILPEFRGIWGKEKQEIRENNIEVFFPLLSRGKLAAILALSQKKSGKYTLENVNYIESIANRVAMSVEKEYLQEELRKSEQELALINKLAGVMTSNLNIQEVYDTFIDGLKEVVDVDFASVTLIDGKELTFSALFSQVGCAWAVGDTLPLKDTATEWVALNKRSIKELDLSRDRMFFESRELYKRAIHSVVYLPLITKGEAIGNLAIASCNIDAYTQKQIHLLERLASQIATSAANSQLYTKAEQRARIDELTGLFNRRHFDETLKQEIDRHSRYGSMVSLVFMDLDNFKSYNDSKGHVAGDKLLAQVGVLLDDATRKIDLTFRYGGDEFAIIMPHTSGDDSFTVAERIRQRLASEMSECNIAITASIGLSSWPGDGLTADDMINGADRALYYAKRTGGNRCCKISQTLTALTGNETSTTAEQETLNTIYALAATIEARDLYTYGHSRKVRSYAVALAEALKLPPEKVAIISHAALLHDIGKIGIYDEVLNKPGKFNIQEMEIIKTHPQLSRTIVAHVPSLTPCLPAILHHHERWDGAGYPSGLKGDAIPLEARILTIADSFDAMTSLRPYRAPLSYKEAIEELKHCAGTQFDPFLVEAFLPIALTVSPEDIMVSQSPENRYVDK